MSSFQLYAQEIAQTSSDCIFTLGHDTILEQANAACQRWFRKAESSQWVGRPIEDLIEDESLLDFLKQAQSELSAGAASFEAKHTIQSGTSSEIVSLSCQSIFDESQNLQGYGYHLNCQSVLAAVAYEETMLRNLMENCEDLIYFKDLDSRFTRVSETMVERLEATSKEEIIGKSDFDFWDNASATAFFENDQEIIRSGQPKAGMTESGVRADGQKSWSLTSKMPLLDELGNVVGIFGINKDITVQKKFETELAIANDNLVEASHRAGMAEVATCVLHNIGNVLNSINVSITRITELNRGMKIDSLERTASLIQEFQTMGTSLQEDERGKCIPAYLDQLAELFHRDQQEVNAELNATSKFLCHLKAIVSSQQEFATGGRALETFDLAELIDDAIAMSSRSLSQHGIAFVREFESGVGVTTDKHRLLQTLVNLIRNAKQALKQVERADKRLVVSIKQPSQDTFSVVVQDNGVGIAEEDLVKIYQHGFTKRDDGHGFGLHSGANFAKELGGSLIASSDGLGQGATFTLTLPTEVPTTGRIEEPTGEPYRETSPRPTEVEV